MSEDITRSQGIALRTIELLQEQRLACTPQNYAVWYGYASGTDKELVKTLTGKIEAGGAISQSAVDEIYDSFLSERATQKAVSDIGETMSDQLSAVQDLIKTASQDTKSYGTTLESVAGQMSKTNDPALMKVVIDNLVNATKQMSSRSEKLEQELQNSANEVNQLKENLKEVRAEAMTDTLTGLPNRRAFDETLEKGLQRAVANNEPFCLILGDIDHFKKFNDTWGHQTGDQVLRLVAHCMAEGTRETDLAARYGGEEFAVIAPSTDLDLAFEIADRIRSEVENKKIMKRSTGEDLGTITMSLGVAQLQSDDVLDSLVKRADACLYAAKHAGRNQVLTEREVDTDRVLDDATAAREAKANKA